MNVAGYSVLPGREKNSYEFLSVGPKGTIKKVVQFQQISPGVFNVAFGDWENSKKRITDSVRSNNKDREKVLTTVALAVQDFIKRNRGIVIIAKGNTPAKTRLYQMGINKN